MSLELRAALLKAAKRSPAGVGELARRLHRRTEVVVSLIREMAEDGLLERRAERRGGRGRPRTLVTPTPLGEDYLDAYRALELKPLRSRRAGLVRAAGDGEYAARLEARGLSPFDLFMELNSLVGRVEKGAA